MFESPTLPAFLTLLLLLFLEGVAAEPSEEDKNFLAILHTGFGTSCTATTAGRESRTNLSPSSVARSPSSDKSAAVSRPGKNSTSCPSPPFPCIFCAHSLLNLSICDILSLDASTALATAPDILPLASLSPGRLCSHASKSHRGSSSSERSPTFPRNFLSVDSASAPSPAQLTSSARSPSFTSDPPWTSKAHLSNTCRTVSRLSSSEGSSSSIALGSRSDSYLSG